MVTLPPLPTLLAFEAVARRRSFALAAGELHLTASAVSHQIARLEAIVGVRLFDRSTASVRLSAAGEAYLARVSGALQALTSATQDVRRGVHRSLAVHATPSLAALWLMPRLADFARAHPDVSLALSASHIHSDFSAGLVDLDIRYGTPQWPNLKVEPIFRERVLPLAAPALVKRLALAKPVNVLEAPLIQSTVSIVQWSDWLAAQDVPEAPRHFALRFDRAQLALEAAVQGLGVALESSTVATPHILSGRLVPVFEPTRAMTVEGHFMVYPAGHARRPEVRIFLEWMRAQARATPDPLAGTRRSPAAKTKR